jgi:hypothetical protein
MDVPRMLQDYGHHVVARQLFAGTESVEALMELVEALTGENFVPFIRSIMPRAVTEIIVQVREVGGEGWLARA